MSTPASPRPVRAAGLFTFLLVAILAAGCGLFGGSPDNDAAQSGSVEKAKLKVGVMIGIDCTGPQLALLNDTFKAEGLEIEPVTVQSGATAMPLLAGGDLDVSFGNWVSFIKAHQSGMADLRFISESYLSTPDSNFAVIAGKDSDITGPKDLTGKKVAVNALKNVNELLLRAVLDANGVDFATVQLVELPFQDMAAAIQNGRVDAAALIDPFVSNAQRSTGARIVFDLTGAGPTENFPLSGFAATRNFTEKNPKTVAAFQRAVLKGQQLTAERGNIEQALPKFAKMDAETAAIVKVGQFPTTIDPKRLQRVADLLVTYGMLGEKVTIEPLVIPVPPSNG
jgi:NitT/TauT family transport system substrate-binding protein